MVSKLIRCCFPNKQESIVIKQEFECGNKEDENNNLSTSQNINIPQNIMNANPYIQNNTDNGQFNDSFSINDFDLKKFNTNHQFSKSVQVNKQNVKVKNIPYRCKTRVSNNQEEDEVDDLILQAIEDVIKEDNNDNKFDSQSSSPKVYPSTKNITKIEEEKYPKLAIKTLVGDALNNDELIITSAGIVNGLRNSRDTITFFGCRQSSGVLDKRIDYELNISNSNLSQLYSPIVFFIYFKRKDKNYYIKTFPQPNESTNSVPNVIVQIKEPYVSHIYSYI